MSRLHLFKVVFAGFFLVASCSELVWADEQPAAKEAQKDDAEIAKLRAEIAKLRDELKAALKEIRESKGAGNETRPRFRGKTADYWLDQLDDADPKFRADAIDAIGMLAYEHKTLAKDKRLIPVLIDLLNDRDGLIAGRAKTALTKIGPDALPGLIELARQKSKEQEYARQLAIDAIGSLNEKAKPGVPALIEAVKESANSETSGRALLALNFIGPEAAEAIPTLVEMLEDCLGGIAKEPNGKNPSHSPLVQKGESIVSTLCRIDPKILQVFPKVKELGPDDDFSDLLIVGEKTTLLGFRRAPQHWRQAIDALKKKYPAPK